MRRLIKIYLGDHGRLVGMLRFGAQGNRESSAFEYDPSWLTSADRFPIDPLLPLVLGPQFHRKTRDGSAFHSAIADTEPDGWGRRVILRAHAKRRQEGGRGPSSEALAPTARSNSLRPSDTRGRRGASRDKKAATPPPNGLDFLLATDDFSRVGALRFQDETGVFQRAPEDGTRRAPPLIELGHLLRATRAVETNRETLADLDYLRGRGTSVGGLRPKCTVVDRDGSLSIGKFSSVTDERSVTKGEVLALRLAALAGIRAAEARLVDSDGSAVALIKRFDRSRQGGRLFYVSAATMLGVDPAGSTQATYADIVDAIRVHGADAQADIDELWRRIAFSILITNVDDHLLNHGFLYAGQGQWRLAPAFDLNPFPDRARELKTWISQETGPDATIQALRSVAPYFRLSAPRAKKILAEVERAVVRWRKEGKALGMTETELDAFSGAFEHSERGAGRAR